MTIKKLIDAALEGGWDASHAFGYNAIYSNSQYNTEFLHEHAYPAILIDPKMWEAAGKTLGWKEDVCQFCGEETRRYGDDYIDYKECLNSKCDIRSTCTEENWIRDMDEWEYKMREMITALYFGSTIKEYIETL